MSNHSCQERTKIKETLSALLDSEAGKVDALELRRLAKVMDDAALRRDDELIGLYQRLVSASAAMQGEVVCNNSLLESVREQIAFGSMPDMQGHSRHSGSTVSPPWIKAVSQFAVAASVAVVTVLVLQNEVSLPLNTSDRNTVASIQSDDVELSVSSVRKLGDNSNRILNQGVLTVGASGSLSPLPSATVPPAHTLPHHASPHSVDCRVGENVTPANGYQPLQLPDGIVLCQMDQGGQNCQATSSAISCRVR